ncbi:MAG: flagellar motor protein MotB [Halothiobacillaceae bacterium]
MAESGDQGRPIVIKKIKKGGHGHHGGAWKIAYADFVTAMMAFFLLMWLLGSMGEAERKGISDYFQNPVKVTLEGGESVGMSESLIDGGGEDLTREEGQVIKQDLIDMDQKTAEELVAEQERRQLEELKEQLESLIEVTPELKAHENQIKLEITEEGLKIDIIDEGDRPMFESGSSNMENYARDIIEQLAPAIDGLPNRLTVLGHTDARPFASGLRTNWELSTERANAARRALVAGGLEEDKFLRISGLADSMPRIKDDPEDPRNRRISVLVMNKEAERAALNESLPAVQAGAQDTPTTESITPPGQQ